MQTMFDVYLAGKLAQVHYGELLPRAEEERTARMARASGGGRRESGKKHVAFNLRESRKSHEEAESLGLQLGRLIYCCYSELLDQGLPKERALELIKELAAQLGRSNHDSCRSEVGLNRS